MHLLIIVIYMFFSQTFLYSQDVDNTAIENPILRINSVAANKNPGSFITLINTSERDLLIDYAILYNIEYNATDDMSALRKKIIARQLNIEADDSNQSEMIKTINRDTFRLTGGTGVFLEAADFIQRYTLKDSDEEIISLQGSVIMKIYNYMLNADNVVYSLKTGEVYADGDLFVQDGGTERQGDWFLYNREKNQGLFYKGSTEFMLFRVDGEILKFYEDKFFSDNSEVSFSRLTPRAHDFLSSKVYFWDQRKIMIFNSIYKIGEQPLLYIPLFMQNYLGTGIISTFGETAREGVYIQNHKTFNFYGVSHKIRFDLYQRLGFMVGDQIRYDNDTQNISLDAMFALGRKYYLLDSYIASKIGFDTRYVNYFDDGEAGDFIPRYRFDYDHSLEVFRNENINSTLSASLLLTSDLYFESDYYNIRESFDIFSFFTSIIGSLSDVEDSNYESYVNNSLQLQNNIYGVNVSILTDWSSSAIRNLSAFENNTNFDYYKLQPSRITLPSIKLSYGDVLGKSTSYYMPDLNINYNLGASYSYVIDYKTSSGIHFEDNPNLQEELYDKLAERHNIGASGNLSRSFNGLFTSFSPTINTEYKKQISVNPRPEDIIYDRQASYLGVGTSMGFSIFLPTTIIPETFTKYFEPTVRLDNNYNLAYRFREEYTTQDIYGGFENNSITSRFRVGGTGYSLFFLPDLNLSAEGYIGTGYDFRPDYDVTTQSYSIIIETNKLLTTEAGIDTRLTYDRSYISADIRRNLLGTNFTSQRISSYFYIPIPLDLLTDLIVERATGDYFFDGIENIFETYVSLSYSHDFINYQYNTIAFAFGVDLQVYKLWRFAFSVESENNRAYRYIPEYAEERGEEWVNPFWDLVDSFDFSSNAKRTASLFKLGSIKASIWHDLDGWELMLSYIVRPSGLPSDLATGSIKGSYWDQELYFTFTLTDFGGVGFPQKDIELNSTIENLRENNTQ